MAKEIEFDSLKASKLSNKINDKIIALQTEKAVIDKLVNAKMLNAQLKSSNSALENHIEKNKGYLEKEQDKVKVIKDTIVTEQALADQQKDQIKSDLSDFRTDVKRKRDEITKDADGKAKEKVADAEARVSDAEERAMSAERIAGEAVEKKRKAVKGFEEYKSKILIGGG